MDRCLQTTARTVLREDNATTVYCDLRDGTTWTVALRRMHAKNAEKSLFQQTDHVSIKRKAATTLLLLLDVFSSVGLVTRSLLTGTR